MLRLRIERFWFVYLLIRLFYLSFSVLVFARISTLGDAERYLGAGFNYSSSVFYNSTALMDCVGGFIGGILGGLNMLSNLPFTLLSFYIVKWTAETLELRKYVSSYILLSLISLPNFCIWTSVCSKEIAGLTFSAILGVLLVNFMNGKYKIRKRDYLATYLCLIFKPQYFPFILQGLVMTYLINERCRTAKAKFLFGIFVIFCNFVILLLIRDIVNEYAQIIPIHFTSLDAASNRNEDIWAHENDFFLKAPVGMLEAFWGPTLSEMLSKPTHLLAGLESLFMMGLFVYLSWKLISRFLFAYKVNATIVPTYFVIFSGICFLHYPFGIFNPGSAIRYRTNFIFLFMLLLLHLYVRYKKNPVFTK